MTTAVPILERGLTAVTLDDYIKSEPRIAELDGTLAAGVEVRKGTPGLDPWIQGAGRRKVAWGVLSTRAVPKWRYL